jgi:monoterpene epsilon-lactone hydrolase
MDADGRTDPCAGASTSLRARLVCLGLRWFIKSKSGPHTTVDAVRRQLALLGRLVPRPPRGTQKTWLDAGGVRAIRVAMPDAVGDLHILYLHGGGYVAGSPSLYRDFIWRIAAAARAQVLCIDYRLAPEHPFPAALDDAVNAYRWLLAEGADPRRVALMGDSSGGGLVFATLLRLRDEGARLPAAAVALSPWTDLACSGASLRRNSHADAMITAEEAPRLAGCYLAGADPRTPYASPLYGDPTGLPPTLIQVGSDESLLDDSVRLAERMRAARCQVELEVWPRMPHVWQVWARLMPEARWAVARIGAFVRSKCGPDGAAPEARSVTLAEANPG